MLQALLALTGFVSLVVAALAARWPRSGWKGVMLGVIAGAATAFVLSFAIGFLEMALPLGQMEFWLAARLRWLWQ